MPLKLSLKPNERIVIDRAIIKNGDSTSKFTIENKVTILREKDLLRRADVDSPCKQIYFNIQLMYIDQENLQDHHKNYWRIVKQVLKASPSMLDRIGKISELVSEEEYYAALKKTKNLIKYEDELINKAKS